MTQMVHYHRNFWSLQCAYLDMVVFGCFWCMLNEPRFLIVFGHKVNPQEMGAMY